MDSVKNVVGFSQICGMKFLIKLRQRAELTGYRTAKRMGIPVNTYYYYEKIAHTIPLNVLVKIRRTFDITWSELGELIEQEFSAPPKK